MSIAVPGMDSDVSRAMQGLALASRFAGLGGTGHAAASGVLPTPEVLPHLLGEMREDDSGSGGAVFTEASVGGMLPLQAAAGGATVQVAGLQLQNVSTGAATVVPDGTTVGPMTTTGNRAGATSAAGNTQGPLSSSAAGGRAFTFNGGSSVVGSVVVRGGGAATPTGRPAVAVAAGVGGMSAAQMIGAGGSRDSE